MDKHRKSGVDKHLERVDKHLNWIDKHLNWVDKHLQKQINTFKKIDQHLNR